MDDHELAEDFEKAAAYLRGIAGKLDSSDLLYLYARFKQAHEGPCNLPKPGFFDFSGKQKWAAWKDLSDLSREKAMEEYILHLDQLDPEWRGKEPEEERGWMSVSTMGRDTDPEVDPNDKSVFDWIKESNLAEVEICLKDMSSSDLDEKDESGLGLIHWASDRGSSEIVRLLLDHGADVNLRDDDLQTALHYACSCGHADVVKTLLGANIDVSLCDNEGLLAKETTSEETILKMFD